MKYKYIIPLIAFIIAMNFLVSCNDFFETPLETSLNEDSIFVKIENTERFLTQSYQEISVTLGNGYAKRTRGTAPDVISDLGACYLGQPAYAAHKFHNAQLTTGTGLTNPIGWPIWGSGQENFHYAEYKLPFISIRYLNIILERLDEVPDASTEQRERIRGEAHLLLAWYHYEMWIRMGGIPLVKKRLDNEADQSIVRSTYEETYNYIMELLQRAIDNPYLPSQSVNERFGRVNKALAYGLRARVQLWAASPLFNTGNPYISLGENNNLICWGNYDKNRWKKAIDAATEAINFCESNGYKIVDDAAGRADGQNYLLASAKLPSDGNTEVIQGWRQKMDVPVGKQLMLPRGKNFNGWAATVPTHNLVQMYRNVDGSFIDWSSPIKTAPGDEIGPHRNLEPRFQVSIGYNGSQFTRNIKLNFWDDPTHSAALSGAESPATASANYSYITRKYSHGYEASHIAPVYDWWILHMNMRLSELYMIRAEAVNEFYGPNADAENDLNKILNRSAMSVPAGMDQNEMREFIERENAIEFFLEDHRYLNLKRTLRAMDVLNFTAVDARVVKNADNSYTFTKTTIQDRLFLKKYYLWPYPQTELNKGYGLIQNPGW